MNFVVTTTALMFQINVLHPCHKEIRNQIDKIERKVEHIKP